ncbi:hypothetical protein C4J81_07515 [Deltaproteobacteria bacterium Smac51]|nr:hypothetical protein C4J81_07515 [Deltaproteobacteria bacterium Smac51]
MHEMYAILIISCKLCKKLAISNPARDIRMDYQKHFKLNESPFKSASDSRFFYNRKAAAAIFAAIADQDCPPVIHLMGPAKVGKTALLKRLPVELREKYKVALILNPHLKLSEILRQALTDFGHSHKFNLHTPEEELLGFFQNAVTDYVEEGFRILLAMDNADELPPETLSDLYGLIELEPQWKGRVILLLSGTPEATWPMVPDIMTPLKDLELPALTDDETTEYVAHRLKAANGDMCFNRQGLRMLAEYGQGRPEIINQLAERAMIAAWSGGQSQVGAEHLKAAKASIDNPLTYNPEAAAALPGGQVAPPPERKLAARSRRGPLFVFLTLALLAAVGFWKLASEQNAIQTPLPEEPLILETPEEPVETATPAGENLAAEDSGAPALPTPPPQLLRLPQGTPVMVIDLDNLTGRLWQGGPRGAGLKAEVASPEFKAVGLYLFGRPRGQNTLVFQYPPAREIPLEEARTLWPRISTLLPQNMLPVIIGRGKDFGRPKNEAFEEAISNRVKAWVQSQQYKFADTTAELYAGSFQFFELGQPARTVSRDDFRAALHSESSTSGDVSLTVSQPLIMQDPANNNIVWAVFQLRYESRLRHDMGTRVLVFEKGVLSQDNWQIAAELWLPEKSLRGD